MKRDPILRGAVHGDMTVVSDPYSKRVGPKQHTCTYVKLKCNVCAREKDIPAYNIYRKVGLSHRSCGFKLHCSRGVHDCFYSSWENMRARTTNPSYREWDLYGGRGIQSDEFKLFIDFYDAMRKKYDDAISIYGEGNVSLDRIDRDGSYTSDNIQWVYNKYNMAKTSSTKVYRLTYPDSSSELWLGMESIARKINVNISTLRAKIAKYGTYKGYKVEVVVGVTTRHPHVVWE